MYQVRDLFRILSLKRVVDIIQLTRTKIYFRKLAKRQPRGARKNCIKEIRLYCALPSPFNGKLHAVVKRRKETKSTSTVGVEIIEMI